MTFYSNAKCLLPSDHQNRSGLLRKCLCHNHKNMHYPWETPWLPVWSRSKNKSICCQIRLSSDHFLACCNMSISIHFNVTCPNQWLTLVKRNTFIIKIIKLCILASSKRDKDGVKKKKLSPQHISLWYSIKLKYKRCINWLCHSSLSCLITTLLIWIDRLV